jgi:hypothetical protein
MANSKPANENSESSSSAAAPAASDLVTEIGTLTYPRAVQRFGKENALAAMREVARIGGHGDFSDEELTHPLFGGLQMPDPEKVIEPRKEDFAKLPEGEFHYQAAVEEAEAVKKQAVANRKAINKYYKSLK